MHAAFGPSSPALGFLTRIRRPSERAVRHRAAVVDAGQYHELVKVGTL